MGITEGGPQPGRQEQSQNEDSWISSAKIESILKELHIPTPLQEKIMGQVGNLAVEGVIAEVDPVVADEYLREVAQRVFGFSIHDLSALELRQIEEIRKRLGVPGEFGPSA